MKANVAVAEASFLAGVAAAGQLPPPALAEIAFAGRSNVGKSSLLNALLGRKHLVRTGSTPGTTRQLNLFHVRATDGLELVLVDLPGYGYAKRGKQERSRWGALVEDYVRTRVTLRAVVLLVDVRRGAEHEERELLEFIASAHKGAARPDIPIILVATKTDKLPRAQRKPAILRIAADVGCRAIGFSAETGEGKEALWQALRASVATGKASSKG
jgi:GTP-binding protein